MKKILYIAIMCLLTTGLAVAGGTDDTATTAGSGTQVSAPGTFPIVDTKVDMSVLTFSDSDLTFDGYWLTDYMEDLTNVHIIWETSPTNRFKEKMNLMFASGEFSDVVNAKGNSLTQLAKPEEMKLIQQGVMLPLNDLIASQSIWYKQRLDSTEGFKEAITAPDGNIYVFAGRGDCYHCMYGEKLWLNKEWLDNLGLDEPTTVEEFYDVMVAFKENDANNNGDPNDEWPISTAKAGAWVFIDGFLMNPFQFTDVGQGSVRRLYMDNGKVMASYMQPGYREGLRWLNKLWEEELIYPDSFTQDRDTSRNLNQSGSEAIFGAVPAMHHGYISSGSGPDVRWREYIGLAPLDGPAGRQTPYYGYTFSTGTTFITAQSEIPEIAFRYFDYFYSEEGGLKGQYGLEGVSWKQPSAGVMGIDGQPAVVETLEVPEDHEYYGKMTWGNRSSFFSFTHSKRSGPQDYMVVGPGDSERFLWYWTDVSYAPYGVPLSKMLPPLFYPEDSISELAQIHATLDEFVYETAVRFITSDLDVDGDWDWFQNELKKIGVDRYLEITQEAYDMSAFAK
jgi:putative aldouronate transport system substrate-binding protein